MLTHTLVILTILFFQCTVTIVVHVYWRQIVYNKILYYYIKKIYTGVHYCKKIIIIVIIQKVEFER